MSSYTTNIVADMRQRKQLGSSNIAILLGVFNKQLFYSRLLDLVGATRLVGLLARGIIVKVIPLKKKEYLKFCKTWSSS